MPCSVVILSALTFCFCVASTVNAQKSRSSASHKEKVDNEVADLRSLLLKAELSGDDEQIVEIARRIESLTVDVDVTRPENFLLATDRLSALKAIYRTDASLAHEEVAAKAQEQVVALTEILYAGDDVKLLLELDELARHYGMMGRIREELHVLNRATVLGRRVASLQSQFTLLCQTVICEVGLGRYTDAARHLRSAERSLEKLRHDESSDADALQIQYYVILGVYYIATEPSYTRAIETLEKRLRLMEATPDYPLRFAFLIELYSGIGEFEKAEACLKKEEASLRREPDPMSALRSRKDRGHLLLRQGRYREAIDTLKDVICFDDGTFGGRGERAMKEDGTKLLAEAYIETSDYDTAERLLRKVQENPSPALGGQAITLSLFGRLYLRQKDYIKAERFLNQAISAVKTLEKENPHWMRQHHHQDLLRDLIQLYRETNRPEKAEEIIRKSGIVEEKDPHAKK